MLWPVWRPETSLQQRWLHNCIESLEKNEKSLLENVFFRLYKPTKNSQTERRLAIAQFDLFDVAVSDQAYTGLFAASERIAGQFSNDSSLLCV